MANEARSRCQLGTVAVHPDRFGSPATPTHVYAAFTACHKAQVETSAVLRSLDAWMPHPLSTDTPITSGCAHAQRVIGSTQGRLLCLAR